MSRIKILAVLAKAQILQKINIPYCANILTLSDMGLLTQAQGLIWFHSGQDKKNSEWLSAWPSEVYEYLGQGRIRINKDEQHTDITGADWFEFLKQKMPNLPPLNGVNFNGGLAGYLSYDLGLEMLDIKSQLAATTLPLATVGLYLWCIHTDHEAQTSCVLIQDDCPASVVEKISILVKQLRAPIIQSTLKTPKLAGKWQCDVTKTDYEKAFSTIKNYIVEGDAYQINLTRQWKNQCTDGNDWALYSRLTQLMPAPFSVFHRTPSCSLLSVSPERFVKILEGNILTQPIKGTRPRSKNKQRDIALKQELADSKKDQAENLMIVDLLRNDIAKNAVPGSIKVDKLFEVQSFRNVHHLVSSISGKLDSTKHPLDVLRDAFPGGSITGAPKKRAMEIIDELEAVRRGNYCGCSFYLTAEDQLDSNILIRTVTLQNNELTCSGGGGIVFDSNCVAEFDESSIKVERILKAFVQ